jgi:hypothetical protein
VEGIVMDKVETFASKMDILHGYGDPDTSILALVRSDWLSPTFDNTWKGHVNNTVDFIYSAFGTRTGLYSYFVAHESDFTRRTYNDTLLWPRIGYAIDRIKQIDPNHKSYVVHYGTSGSPPFPNGITLAQFASRFQNLGIYEVDDYVFWTSVGTNYYDQQTALDQLILTYQDCMVSFRNSTIEWHPVIQACREYINSASNMIRRRPIFNEMRVQAYLALSRGARGVTSYVYGTIPLPPPTELYLATGQVLYSLLGTSQILDDTYYVDGLVDADRNGFTEITDAESIPAFSTLS